MVLLVNTNMCVARHMMLMMLLQLPGFWSWAAVVALFSSAWVVNCPKQGAQVAQKCCHAVLGLHVVLLVSTHMCVHRGRVLLVLSGRFPLCCYCFWAGGQKTPDGLHIFMGWVICGVVGEHKHVCSKAYDAHDVAAVARFLVLGCCCCCCCRWVRVLNCSEARAQVAQKCCHAVLGLCVVDERTHVCAQGHSVAGSGCAVSFVLLLFYGQVEKTPKSHTYVFTGWVICGVVGKHKHVCSKACDAHDVAAVARFLVLGSCFCCCCCCSSVWVVNCP